MGCPHFYLLVEAFKKKVKKKRKEGWCDLRFKHYLLTDAFYDDKGSTFPLE